ncbi:MAG: hypothetical protein A2W85_16660 [Bacteroidetes bacterium GWF2_41_31]|nr:MAG: hypothetical protein A2W85_16660 [Bacteroidetes bacterium GWF2_41_31]OFZ07983.1 MAG: hypothetical protein A2338_09465 [Bacteroidetes bacterium RIFOXYB12_FULL_41_6]
MLNNPQSKNNDIWMKAAVVGGLWASVEIIIGSFLHNTRIPFAGSILAISGTILLIGFYQIWPHRGMIIRAGLITALMKSVSPSALILGPMTGIFMEAALIELVILLLGANLPSYLIAGIFSVSSALFHKIISLVIVYSFDLLRVYVNMINFALKQFRLAAADPMEIFTALLLVYVVMGSLAGWMGYLVGRKAKKMSAEKLDISLNSGIKNREFFPVNPEFRTSVWLLAVHIIAIPLGLFLLNYIGFYIGLSYVVIYSLFVGFRYRFAMRRLRKPVFWLQLVFILLLSTFFWNIGKKAFGPSLEGARVGFEMMIRALFIIMAFTSLSVELRNKHIRNFLFSVGMGQFYQALGLAFGALPIMISLLPGSKEIVRNPLKSLLKPIVMADQWLEIFSNKPTE